MSDEYHRARLVAEADGLRQLAVRLANCGVGERWQGATQIQCEIALMGLVDDLLTHSRRLEHVGHYATTRSVMARLG
jgi:hypothetical protein